MHETITKRLFVGGLASEVTSEEIIERFSRFGKVSNLSLKTRTDESGNRIKSFAHLDLEAEEASIKKCFSTYQNTKWKGLVLQLQYAKESFLQKLEKEREEARNELEQGDVVEVEPVHTWQPPLFEVKGPAVPGTPVPGKKEWVVGKYGRVLPILKLKKSYKIKMMKYDPSKHCHAAKVFKDDQTSMPTDSSCNKLTWEINAPDTEITKKRKGIFPQTVNSVKKVKKCELSPSEYFRNSQPLIRKVEAVEFVKVGSGNGNVATKLLTSNRFDSDLESDTEGDSLGKHVSNGVLGKEKWLNGPTHGSKTKLENNEIVSLKINENRDDKEVEFVTVGSGNVNVATKLITSNRFDSDLESDTERDSLGKNVSGLQAGKDKWFNGPKPGPETKLENDENVRLKINENRDDKNTVSKSAGKGLIVSVSVSKNSQARQVPNVNVINGAETSTSSAVKHSLQTKHSASICKKIPQFKGLGMLGLLQECSRTCQEKLQTTTDHLSVDKSDVTMTNSAVGESSSSHSISDKSTSVSSFAGLNIQSSVSDGGNNSSANTTTNNLRQISKLKEQQKQSSQKSSVPVKDTLLPRADKQPPSSVVLNDITDIFRGGSALKNYDSSSSADTDEIIARCKRRKGVVPSTEPESELPSGNSSLSNCLSKCEHSPEKIKQSLSSVLINDTPDTLGDDKALKNYDSSSSADTDEIIARCKRRKGMLPSDVLVTQMPSEKLDVSNSERKTKTNKQENSLVLINDVPDLLRDDSSLKNYDSSSSADTDEIIARCKQRKGLISSAIAVSGASDKTNSVRKNEPGTQADLSPGVNRSSCDANLRLSDNVAGTYPAQPMPTLNNEDTLYDSDLDSNDFALVAKKLMEKSVSSKIGCAFNNKLKNVKNDNTSPATRQDISKKTHENMKKNIAVVSSVEAVASLPVKSETPKRATSSWIKVSSDKDSHDSSFDHREEISDSKNDRTDDDEEEESDEDESIDDEDESDDEEEEESTDDEDESDDEEEEEESTDDEDESDDEEEEDSDVEEEEENNDDCKEISQPSTDVDKRLEEKSDSLKVAENVFGTRSLIRASDKFKNSSVPIIDMSALRFDPTKLQKTETVTFGKKTLPHREMTTATLRKQTDNKLHNISTMKVQQSERKVNDRSKVQDAEPERKAAEVKANKELSKLPDVEGINNVKLKAEKGRKQTDNKLHNISTMKVHQSERIVSDRSNVQPERLRKAAEVKVNEEPSKLSVEGINTVKLKAEKGSVKKSFGSETKVHVLSSLVGLFGKKNPDSARLEAPAPFLLLQVFDRQLVDVKDDALQENGKLHSNKGAEKVDTRYSRNKPLERLAEIKPTLVKTFKRKHEEATKNERKIKAFKRSKFSPKSRRNNLL